MAHSVQADAGEPAEAGARLHGPFIDDQITALGDPGMSYDELVEAQERNITTVLDLLVRHKITGTNDTATIAVSEVIFVGHVVGNGQWKPILGEVPAIDHLEKPKTVSDLWASLGFCYYYSRYIKVYAEYATPMTSMLKGIQDDTKKGSKKAVRWNEGSFRAFERMKQALLSAVAHNSWVLTESKKECISTPWAKV